MAFIPGLFTERHFATLLINCLRRQNLFFYPDSFLLHMCNSGGRRMSGFEVIDRGFPPGSQEAK